MANLSVILLAKKINNKDFLNVVRLCHILILTAWKKIAFSCEVLGVW